MVKENIYLASYTHACIRGNENWSNVQYSHRNIILYVPQNRTRAHHYIYHIIFTHHTHIHTVKIEPNNDDDDVDNINQRAEIYLYICRYICTYILFPLPHQLILSSQHINHIYKFIYTCYTHHPHPYTHKTLPCFCDFPSEFKFDFICLVKVALLLLRVILRNHKNMFFHYVCTLANGGENARASTTSDTQTPSYILV